MNILLASSEAVPFAKTGGLADVCGALPRSLARLGHQVHLFLPNYRSCRDSGQQTEATSVELQIPVGSRLMQGRLLRSSLPDSNVTVWLVDQPEYYDRAGLYGEAGQDYQDNCARFVFFCRAILESIRKLDLAIDLVHCNDWQTGLLPVYLRTEYAASEHHRRIASLLTVHNLGYQGLFLNWDMQLTGLDWSLFNWQQMEFYGQLNLLKSGLVFADAISTVSPTYAREIQTEQQGYGLDGVLRARAGDLHGILNGIDADVWNPAVDRHLVQKYDRQSWVAGKAANKAALQRDLGLNVSASVPLIGSVGRIASQKGFSLILPVMQQWLGTIDAQWVFLGTGDTQIEQQLLQLERRWPGKVAVQVGFSDAIAHRIEAGADLFLMPSQYEPCGLNQMYSMAYGTVPVVRHTGGLADTVIDASLIGNAPATGYSFVPMRPEYLEQALARAVNGWWHDRGLWEQLVQNGMSRDWSWASSAHRYAGLYATLVERARQRESATVS